MSSLLLNSPVDSAQADGQEPEIELIERAKQSPQALGELYRIHQPRIMAYVARRIGNVQEAEDIVANVFLAMVRRLPKFRTTKAPFSAWLYRIATNEINWFLRKQWVRRAFVPMVDVADTRREPSDDAEHVRKALLKLPVRFQSVLSLHYLEEQSVAEISNILGIAEGTVKSRLARGRARLRKTLA